MQCLEVSGAVRPIYGSLDVKQLIQLFIYGAGHLLVNLVSLYKVNRNNLTIKVLVRKLL